MGAGASTPPPSARIKENLLLPKQVSYIRSTTPCFWRLNDTLQRAEKIALFIHENILKARSYLNENKISIKGNENENNKYKNNRIRLKWKNTFALVKFHIAISKTIEALSNDYRLDLKQQKGHTSNMLYQDSKLFTQTQEILDVNIYLHDNEPLVNRIPNKSPVLEVIGYDWSKRKELMRLYLNYKDIRNHIPVVIKFKQMLLSKQNADVLVLERQIVVGYIMSILAQRFDPNQPSVKFLTLDDNLIIETSTTEEVQAIRRSNNKINRLQLNISSPRSDTLSSHIQHKTMSHFLIDENIVLKSVRPVYIQRRRKSIDDEFSFVFNKSKFQHPHNAKNEFDTSGAHISKCLSSFTMSNQTESETIESDSSFMSYTSVSSDMSDSSPRVLSKHPDRSVSSTQFNRRYSFDAEYADGAPVITKPTHNKQSKMVSSKNRVSPLIYNSESSKHYGTTNTPLEF